MELSFKSRYLMIISALLISGLACSSYLSASPSPDDKGKYSIIRMVDHEGNIQFEVIESDILKYVKKEMDGDYKQAKQEWACEKKNWVKLHGKAIPFTKPSPLKPSLKEIVRNIASKSAAKIEKETAKSKGPFCVVQIVVGSKKEKPEIIKKVDISCKKFSIAREHFSQVKSWVEQKAKLAKENPEAPFTEACPASPQLKILKNSLKTMEKASAYLSKCRK